MASGGGPGPAARTAFAATGAETSMAGIARRSGVGPATLYRNFATRRELLEALLAAAQDAGQIARDLDLDQILDLVVAIAKIRGTPEYRQPILGAALAGLRPPGA